MRSDDTRRTATDLYSLLDAWMESPWDNADIERFAAAPADQLEQFSDEAYSLEVELRPDQVPSGLLRPGVFERRGASRTAEHLASQALLYTHQVVVEVPHLSDGVERAIRGEPEPFKHALRYMRAVRPLVESGVVQFALGGSRTRHPASQRRNHEARNAILEYLIPAEDEAALTRLLVEAGLADVLQADAGELDDRVAEVVGTAELMAQWPQTFSPLLLSGLDMFVWRQLLREPASEAADARRVALSKLVTLQLPALDSQLENVVRVRTSETVFDDWRQALSAALAAIGEVEQSPNWAVHAREIVAAELEPFRTRISTQLKRSEPLSNMFQGVGNVGLAAFGATVGAAASGNLAAGIASGAATAVGRAVLETFRGRQDIEPKKAVLELATVFGDWPHGP